MYVLVECARAYEPVGIEDIHTYSYTLNVLYKTRCNTNMNTSSSTTSNAISNITLAHLNCIGSVEKWRSFQSKVVRNQSVEPSARLEEMVLSAAGVDQLLARRHSATFQDLKTHKWTHYSYRRSTRIGLRTIRRSDCFKRVCARTSFVHSILVLVTLLLYTKVVQKWFAINS